MPKNLHANFNETKTVLGWGSNKHQDIFRWFISYCLFETNMHKNIHKAITINPNGLSEKHSFTGLSFALILVIEIMIYQLETNLKSGTYQLTDVIILTLINYT